MRKTPLRSRSAPLRSREPARGGYIQRKTRIKQVNPERQAKRRTRQAAKHRAYMRSETRKIVDRRANDRCEAVVWTYTDGSIRVLAPAWDDARLGIRLHEDDVLDRCENMATAHHHLTYFRYGGDELPEDMLKVCRRCHDYLEHDHPTRRAHRSAGRTHQENE